MKKSTENIMQPISIPSAGTCIKNHVRRRHSYRRKQLLNWYRTANPEKFTDFHYTRWVRKVGGFDMKDAIYKATEDELDDLYILREELRLGI
jgi:hypothetical protein